MGRGVLFGLRILRRRRSLLVHYSEEVLDRDGVLRDNAVVVFSFEIPSRQQDFPQVRLKNN